MNLSRLLLMQKEICEILHSQIMFYLKLLNLLKDGFLFHEVELVTIELREKEFCLWLKVGLQNIK